MFNIAIPIIPIGFIADTFQTDRLCSDRFQTDMFHTNMFCLGTNRTLHYIVVANTLLHAAKKN